MAKTFTYTGGNKIISGYNGGDIIKISAAAVDSYSFSGNDLIFSTPRQIYLQQTLGFSTPTYCHIPLLVDANGRRLSKREGDGCMEVVREKYKDPVPVLGALAAALGLLPAPESVSLLDLVALFDLAKIPRDTVKLP